MFQANSLHLHQQMVHTTIPNHMRNNPGGHTFSAAVPALLSSSHCLCREAAYYGIPDDHHLPDSMGLPPVDSYNYVEWQEESSEEHDGWYHCVRTMCSTRYKQSNSMIKEQAKYKQQTKRCQLTKSLAYTNSRAT